MFIFSSASALVANFSQKERKNMCIIICYRSFVLLDIKHGSLSKLFLWGGNESQLLVNLHRPFPLHGATQWFLLYPLAFWYLECKPERTMN